MYSTLCSLNSTILHFKEHERCPSKLQNFKLQFQECLHFDEVNLLSVCITTWVLYNNIKRNNCCMVTSLQRVDPKPSLKIRTANAIFWISLGIRSKNVFLGTKLFCFSRQKAETFSICLKLNFVKPQKISTNYFRGLPKVDF